ncbi:MAG TPA: nickel-binding protein, partial [Chitinophagaceae bacterium]
MPIFMDVHNVPGVKARDVAEAHYKDLLHQAEHGCKCMTYWIDEDRETIFCLVEAPAMDAVEQLHSRAHGLIPNKIIEVSTSLVQAFLGRIYDPSDARVMDNGLKVFADPSFRILLFCKLPDRALLRRELGREAADAMLTRAYAAIRSVVDSHGGREVEREGHHFLASFSIALKAFEAALALQVKLKPVLSPAHPLRLSLDAGEPVQQSGHLFGDTVQNTEDLALIAPAGHVVISASVWELLAKDHSRIDLNGALPLSTGDEELVALLFSKLRENWQDVEFDLDNYCRSVAMSKSQ